MGLKAVTKKVKTESYDTKGEVVDENWKKVGAKAVQYGAEKNIPGTGVLAKGLDKLNKLTSKKSKSTGGDSQRAKQSLPKPKKDAPKQSAPSRQESYDAYDLVLNYIMETEQASTIEEANYIMMEMNQNTIHEIVEAQKKSLDEGKKTVIGLGLLAAPALLSQLEKRWNPVKKARDKYQDKKATEYEKKSGTTKEDGYFR